MYCPPLCPSSNSVTAFPDNVLVRWEWGADRREHDAVLVVHGLKPPQGHGIGQRERLLRGLHVPRRPLRSRRQLCDGIHADRAHATVSDGCFAKKNSKATRLVLFTRLATYTSSAAKSFFILAVKGPLTVVRDRSTGVGVVGRSTHGKSRNCPHFAEIESLTTQPHSFLIPSRILPCAYLLLLRGCRICLDS